MVCIILNVQLVFDIFTWNIKILGKVIQKKWFMPQRGLQSYTGVSCSVSLPLYSLHVSKFPVFSSQPSEPLLP